MEEVLALVDVARMRGLEFGPLHRPRVPRSAGPIEYIDHLSTEDLRTKYAANEEMRPFLDQLVEVDHVIAPGQSMAEAVGGKEIFDYALAAHVVEHVADPLGWLADIATILKPAGILSLAVPDKRFTFDVNRVETQMREWVDWHLRGLTAPGFGQLFDWFANVVTIDGMVDTAGLWAGTASYDGVRRADVPDPDQHALAVCEQQRRTGEYVDVHGAVYTPRSFLRLLEVSARIGLLDYELAAFFPTPRDTLEFYVSLRRTTAGTPASDAAESFQRALASVQEPADAIRQPASTEAPQPAPALSGLTLSAREERLIAAKRKVMTAVRDTAGAVRARRSPGSGRLR